jgi:hypothetical protein
MSLLGLNNGGGGAYVRFLPSVNSWQFQGKEIALDSIVFDHESVKTGWGKMAEGQAPEWTWDAALGKGGPQPSPDHKRGFSVRMWTKATGTVEWSSNGTGPAMGFETLWTAIVAGMDANPGQVPVVKFTGSTPMKVGKGNTRVPNFTVERWVPRAKVPWDAEGEAPAPAPAAPAPAQDGLEF